MRNGLRCKPSLKNFFSEIFKLNLNFAHSGPFCTLKDISFKPANQLSASSCLELIIIIFQMFYLHLSEDCRQLLNGKRVALMGDSSK